MPSPTSQEELVATVARLRELMAKATPGPYRAHDHSDMARLGEDPEKWMGYAWVGRITKQSEPDGRFDAGWLDRDSRRDACREYRERASDDAHFVAEALNALPALLDLIERLTSAPAGEQRAREIARMREVAKDCRRDAIVAFFTPSPSDGWRPIATAPHACHVLAARFDGDEWVMAVVSSPPSKPFTHWCHLPNPPSDGSGEGK